MNDKSNAVWRERLASPLTWHYAGFAVLLVAVIALATRFALDWAATSARTTDALATKQIQLKTLELQTAPLRGLDKRIDLTRDEIKEFYDKRIPANYSSIAEQIGDLEVKSGVRLTRLQYAQKPPANNLSEITLDAGVTGEYPQIMRFINSLERSKTLFVTRGMGLTGQQGGTVNLRLQLSTWLRPADAAASGLPQHVENGGAGETPEQTAGQQEGQPQ
jgi:Tfp pilus assembly protein PilN